MKIYFFSLLLTVLNAVSVLAQVKQSPPLTPDYDTMMVKATAFTGEGEYKKVIDLLKDFPENDTAYATSLDKLALAYLGEEKWDEAITTSKKGLTLRSPYKRHFYEMLAAAYDEKKDYTQALDVLKEGQKEFPLYTRFYYQTGVTSMNAKKYEQAYENLKTSIRLNPFETSAHLQLGLLMYNSNRMIPAMLSFHIFLMLDPATSKSINVLREYEKMGNGEYKSNKDSLYLNLPATTDNFQELEAIVQSKFALNSNYKSNVKIKYNTIVKTMQIIGEKIEMNKADTGFYMQFYVPIFLEMVQNNLYNSSIYYNLRSIDDEEVRKEVKKQDANITKMASYLNNYLTKYRQDQWRAHKMATNDTWFNTTGTLSSEGAYNSKSNLATGDYTYYWPSGHVKSKGSYTASGKSTGKWQYYYPEGELQAIKYYKDDLLVDSTTFYHPEGNVSEVIPYKNDKHNGVVKSFYATGGPRTLVTFANGVRTGPVLYHYANGRKKLEGNLVNEKLNGKYIEYYDNGKKLEEADYKDGVITGTFKSWYGNGNLKSEGAYKNGLKEGEWKYYHEEGYLNNSGNYKAGKEDGIWKSLDQEGKVFSELKYSGGKIEGDANFYDDGKLWSVLTFGKGNIKKYKYYDKNNKVISEGVEKNGVLDLKSFYADGSRFRERIYKDGIAMGKCTTWNMYGNTESLEYYADDEQDGKQQYYFDDGTLKSEINYKAGVLEGLAVYYYKNGVISSQGWYKDDNKRGEWREYNPDGVISSTDYYQNGELQGASVNYDVSGKMETVFTYNNGDLVMYTDYDTLGNILIAEKIKNGSGSFNSLHLNKKAKSNLNYKNGRLEGEIKRYYSNGKVRNVILYTNGSANGPYKRYEWDGSIDEEGFYEDGYIDSTRTTYKNGKLYSKANYFRGDLHGEREFYYPNGVVSTRGNFRYDNQEGYFYYYADNGMVRYRLLFKDGDVQSYSYLAPDSTFKPEIPLPKSTGDVKAFYQNGNPSVSFTFKGGYYHGPFIQYFPSGKVRKEINYVSHEEEGTTKEYNEAGKLVSEENNKYDRYDGVCRYYNNGVLERESVYVMNWMHGPTKLYDKAGKVIKTVKMYNDEPFE